MASSVARNCSVALRLLICSAALAVGGCAKQQPRVTTQPADPVSEDAAIALADKEAALQLAAFNEEPWTKELGGPFLLQDYSRTVSLKTRGDETVFMVYYEYKRPVTFDGHPRHFSVWVNQATGAVRFFAGR